MRFTVKVSSRSREELIDITNQVRDGVVGSGIKNGIVSLYVQGATAAVMIQENWDDSVQNDVITLLRRLAPRGVWEHDRQDGNGDATSRPGWWGRPRPFRSSTAAWGFPAGRTSLSVNSTAPARKGG